MAVELGLDGPHFCGACGTVVMVEVEGSYIKQHEDWENLIRIVFGQCVLCKSPIVLSRHPTNYTDRIEWSDTATCLYPNDDRILPFPLPPKVGRSYEQAIRTERGQAGDATVVMVGRTLEAVTHDIAATTNKKRSLFDGLKAMQTEGAISEEMLAWAEDLRGLRNIGAHARDEEVTDEDAKDALDFLQAILETIYHFRPRFKDLQARRAKPTTPDT